jgi:hypothetical protein
LRHDEIAKKIKALDTQNTTTGTLALFQEIYRYGGRQADGNTIGLAYGAVL